MHYITIAILIVLCMPQLSVAQGTPLFGGAIKFYVELKDGLWYCNNEVCHGAYADSLDNKGSMLYTTFRQGLVDGTFVIERSNGDMEKRFYKGINQLKELYIYRADSSLKEVSIYKKYNERPVLRKVYHSTTGTLAMIEKRDARTGTLTMRKAFYDIGVIETDLKVYSKKKQLYTCKKYYPHGKIWESGLLLIQNNGNGPEYEKVGNWQYYNVRGELKE